MSIHVPSSFSAAERRKLHQLNNAKNNRSAAIVEGVRRGMLNGISIHDPHFDTKLRTATEGMFASHDTHAE